MKTYIRKSTNGWQAETEVHVPAISENTYLVVMTYKSSSGGLYSYAKIVRKEGVFNCFQFGDYSERMFMNLKSRVTKAMVIKQHEESLSWIDGYIAKAVLFYQKQAA